MAKNPVRGHVLTVGGKKFRISVEDEYKEIGSIVGIVLADGTNDKDIDDGGEIGELIESGKIVKLKVRGIDATTKKTKRNSIYCASDKIGAAKGGLTGKKLINAAGGGNETLADIKKVYFPTHYYRR